MREESRRGEEKAGARDDRREKREQREGGMAGRAQEERMEHKVLLA